MADANKYAEWIVANQDKKGTPEFETVAKAYQLAKSSTLESFSSNPLKYIKGGIEDLGALGRGIIGESAKFAGRVIPGVTGEELQSKVESSLAPKQTADNRMITANDLVKTGRLATDIGAAYAVPSALGAVASKIPAAAKYAQALSSGGFDLGNAALKGSNVASKLGNILMKTGAGVGTNLATNELVNPDEWKSAAAWGVLPAGLETAKDILKAGGTKFMTSAVKPDLADFESGDAQKAIQTMLEQSVNPTMHRTIWGRGLDTVQKKINDLNNEVKLMVANANGNVSKQDVLNALDSYAAEKGKQLAPDADLAAIKTVRDQIVANKQMPTNYVPAQIAQELKQGTYKAVGERAYGQETAASKEAQKVGAKALKEGIERVVPNVAPLNKQESELLNMLNVVERKAYAQLKNNPGGLATIAPNDLQAIATMADRSAPFKALVGRLLYHTGDIGTNVPLANVPAVLSTQGE
jgi:hypothetical protein